MPEIIPDSASRIKPGGRLSVGFDSRSKSLDWNLRVNAIASLKVTIEELQKEVEHLPEDQQDVLAAYLTMLRRGRDPEWEDTLLGRLQDRSSQNWADLDEFAD